MTSEQQQLVNRKLYTQKRDDHVIYSASQQLDIFCELLRNIQNANEHMNLGKFDHAALCFELAASKLRTLQRERECQNP
jgi:hypothetical protein